MHYFEHGAREGRDPSPDFDTSYYLERYPDVDECGVNPLLHFRLHGAAEGRRPVRGSHLKARILQPLQVSKSLNEIVPAAPAPTEERREPLISVIMPTFNTPRRYLLLAIESVLRQSYQGWQLCIYDDGSSAADTLELLKEYRERDSRIRVKFGSRNQGIGAASNQAMALATGRYVAMLDHDDVIVPEALLEIANALNGDPAIDALYTDQAYVEADGSCVQPFFKPDWSPEMFRGVMFVNHLLAVRRTLAMDLGGFDTRFDRAQDFEFMLRVSEKSVKIHHLPKVLYHWRRIQGSVAFHGDQKGAIEPIQAAAVNAHLKRINIPAIAEPHPTLAHRLTIKPAPRKSAPSVLVVVRDATASDSNPECLSSILGRSTYSNFQVLRPRLPHSVIAAQDPRVMIGDTGVRKYGTADYLVWIDSDLELLTPDWIEHLLLYCEQPQIACATPLILNRDGAVWDAGLVLGMNGLIGYPMRGLPADSDGYAGSLSCAREVTCASGACMMVSRQRLEALGDLVQYYQDSLYQGADLSLRAATAGFRNIVNPRVTLRRLDNSSAAEGCELDRELFKDRWGAIAKYGDRYYNPNFKLISPGYQTAETAMAAAV
jgi:glycosyltransferase involved in cell wall biosynthesis